MCRLCACSASGFYAWLTRPESARARRDAELGEKVEAIHRRSRGTYGAPRVHAELRAQGERVGRKRVARLMKARGLAGVSRRRGCRTTSRDEAARPAPDLVERAFAAEAPDRLWVADITYVPTWEGFLYLAVVLDVFSRRCEEAGVRPSMGSVGDCFDNAMAESFFATLECELLDRSTFRTRAEAERAIFEFIEGWYNPHRRHSALGYVSPVNFERQHARCKGGCQTPNGELSTEAG